MQPLQVRGSAADLTRLVRNLLDNAARHAERRIAVDLREETGHAVLMVDDDGRGCPSRTGSGSSNGSRGWMAAGRAPVAGGDRTRPGATSGRSLRGKVTVRDAPLGGARFEVRLPTD